MDPQRKVTSRIGGANRTFFIDLKQDPDGSHSIHITENKRRRNGSWDHVHIVLCQDEIPAFHDALTKVCCLLNEKMQLGNTHFLQQPQEVFTNTYKPWSPEEDIQLRELFRQNLSSRQIAAIMHRNKVAITSRLVQMGLKTYCDQEN